MAISELKNPFEIKPPEELSPQLIHDLFVKEYTEHTALIGDYHTFISGSRGSGKSMHFKYLEPQCQLIEHGSLDAFLKSESPFIGIYINCNKGDFTKEEFKELTEDKNVPDILWRKLLLHYFIMDTAECIIKTFVTQLAEFIEPVNQVTVFDRVNEVFELTECNEKTLLELKRNFHKEKIKIDRIIDNYLENIGLAGNRLNATGVNFVDTSLDDGRFLHILLSALRSEILKRDSIPFYLLYDEANELLEFQKKIINTLISQRKQTLVCVKVSCQPRMYNVFMDIKERLIQETHDYYFIELDSLYTTDKTTYHERLREIANRRLDIAGFHQNSIILLLPDNLSDIKKIEEAKKIAGLEYDKIPEGKRPAKKNEYIKKYAMARFYQQLLGKTSYGYTGFNNLVHFSSGIIRSFLEPCYSMIEEMRKRALATEIRDIASIPFQIQKEVIENYSNMYIQKDILDHLKIEPAGSDKRKILVGLLNILESLGTLFSMRLRDKNSREPRIISFSIKEGVRDPLLQDILDHGVQKAFFHQKWYRAKSGHEMLECYILNRRLCPRYHLDLSSFQGRFEMSQDDLLLAASNSSAFTKKFEKETEELEQMQLFDF